MKEPVLIQRLMDGSQSAFEDIYKIYSGQLFGFCLRYTKSKELSRDIVQEVFIKLWDIRASIREKESLRSLIFVMARNRLINAYRANVNSPIYEQYVDFINDASLSSNNASHQIEYDDFCNRLDRELGKLSKTQREVFKCCKIEQLTTKETSEKLGLSEQTVKNQLTMAMKELRGRLLIFILSLIHLTM